MTDIICGVVVSAKMLDARIGSDGPLAHFARTTDGIAALTGFCREDGVTQMAIKATGGCEQKPFALLWGAGIPRAVLNPRMVRRFAEVMGSLEKTDRIDAGIIAIAKLAGGAGQGPRQAQLGGVDSGGLAPIARGSGSVTGKRYIAGRRADVRSILVLVARAVRRYNDDFAAFHKRLVAAGKPLMVANVALARKLLVRLNPKARDARLGIEAQAKNLPMLPLKLDTSRNRSPAAAGYGIHTSLKRAPPSSSLAKGRDELRRTRCGYNREGEPQAAIEAFDSLRGEAAWAATRRLTAEWSTA